MQNADHRDDLFNLKVQKIDNEVFGKDDGYLYGSTKVIFKKSMS